MNEKQQTSATRTKTLPWDPAEYLNDRRDVVAYLEAAFEDGDPCVIASVFEDIARSNGKATAAETAGLGTDRLHEALSNNGNLGIEALFQFMLDLGMPLQPVRNDQDRYVP